MSKFLSILAFVCLITPIASAVDPAPPALSLPEIAARLGVCRSVSPDHIQVGATDFRSCRATFESVGITQTTPLNICVLPGNENGEGGARFILGTPGTTFRGKNCNLPIVNPNGLPNEQALTFLNRKFGRIYPQPIVDNPDPDPDPDPDPIPAEGDLIFFADHTQFTRDWTARGYGQGQQCNSKEQGPECAKHIWYPENCESCVGAVPDFHPYQAKGNNAIRLATGSDGVKALELRYGAGSLIGWSDYDLDNDQMCFAVEYAGGCTINGGGTGSDCKFPGRIARTEPTGQDHWVAWQGIRSGVPRSERPSPLALLSIDGTGSIRMGNRCEAGATYDGYYCGQGSYANDSWPIRPGLADEIFNGQKHTMATCANINGTFEFYFNGELVRFYGDRAIDYPEQYEQYNCGNGNTQGVCGTDTNPAGPPKFIFRNREPFNTIFLGGNVKNASANWRIFKIAIGTTFEAVQNAVDNGVIVEE